jgi:polyferredoxin
LRSSSSSLSSAHFDFFFFSGVGSWGNYFLGTKGTGFTFLIAFFAGDCFLISSFVPST